VAEDAERSVRPVEIDESQFQKVKPLVREGDAEKAAAEAEAAERAAARKAAKKQRSDNIIVSAAHGNRKFSVPDDPVRTKQSAAALRHCSCSSSVCECVFLLLFLFRDARCCPEP